MMEGRTKQTLNAPLPFYGGGIIKYFSDKPTLIFFSTSHPHALLDLWCNIPTKFHSNPCKDVGGVEKTNFDGTEGWKDGMMEGRTKQTLNAPLPFYGGGIIKYFSDKPTLIFFSTSPETDIYFILASTASMMQEHLNPGV